MFKNKNALMLKKGYLEIELELELKQISSQEQMLKMQVDATAAMHQMVTRILLKKSHLEKYTEQKASIAKMLSADIAPEVANQLTKKLL